MPELTDTELAELEKDRARLDWMQSRKNDWLDLGAEKKLNGEIWWFMDWFGTADGKYQGIDIRQVIDAAMEAEKEGSDGK